MNGFVIGKPLQCALDLLRERNSLIFIDWKIQGNIYIFIQKMLERERKQIERNNETNWE